MRQSNVGVGGESGFTVPGLWSSIRRVLKKSRPVNDRVDCVHNRHWTGRLFAVMLSFLPVLLQCHGQGTFTRITFDGPPLQPPGTQYRVQQYYEAGMSFTPIDPNAPWSGFGRNGGGVDFYPENGTAYLQAGLTSTLKFSFMNGVMFNLESVDLAEYSTVVPDAVTVHFVGYRFDGSVISKDWTTDGIIDGTGPLVDFQTFQFGPEWNGLSRVEIPTYGWSLDNLVVSQIPEPSTLGLMILGAALAIIPLFRRKRGNR